MPHGGPRLPGAGVMFGDRYHASRCLPVAGVSPAGSLAVVTDAPDTLYVVRSFAGKRCSFLEMVFITDAALSELCRLGSHARSGDAWTPNRMKNYICYTWVGALDYVWMLAR